MNTRFASILENLRFFLSILLVFLLVFEKYIHLPAFLAVLGRMHPLILHFPITLAAVGGIGLLFPAKYELAAWARRMEFWSVTASITALTALFGLFLSREGGYDEATLNWHKYSAAILTLGAGYLAWRFGKGSLRAGFVPFGLATLALTLICGHQGGVLTHGSNFLLEPVRPNVAASPVVADVQKAEVFRDVVRPILEKKCFNCHNPNKTKGDLLMTTLEGLKKGGENGPIFIPFQPDSSHMIMAAHLPEDDDKHMPPAGKPQLTPDELKIIHFWIKKGADFGAKVSAYLPNDTLDVWTKSIPTAAAALPQIPAASEKTIESLKSNFCNIRPLAQGSPYLEVVVLNHQDYQADVFKKLQKISKNIYRLETSGAPVTDQEINAIAGLENLRELGLGRTKITGKNLSDLLKLKHLQVLKLHANKLKAKDIEPLLGSKNLHLYLWGNPLEEKELAQLRKKAGSMKLDLGTPPDTAVLQLNKPIAEKPVAYFQNSTELVLSHPLQGVKIYYTTDGRNPDGEKGIGKVYKAPILVKNDLQIKYRAELDGWHASVMDSLAFKKTRFIPDRFELKVPADPKYMGGGDSVIFNLAKGGPNHTVNDGWLGFHSTAHLDVECFFKNPPEIQKVSIGTLLIDNAYITPPVSLEVWGSNTKGQWEKIGTQSFPIPTGPQYGNRFYDCKVKPGKYAYLKVVSKPIAKLPSWHRGKGEPGWLFVDEVLIN